MEKEKTHKKKKRVSVSGLDFAKQALETMQQINGSQAFDIRPKNKDSQQMPQFFEDESRPDGIKQIYLDRSPRFGDKKNACNHAVVTRSIMSP